MGWADAGTALGGVGLLLLGMGLLTDGLKRAAGSSLNRLLGSWTRSRTRGLAAGALITAIVQSSSAVTVAIIGFANAGLLTLPQAAWVVFGSNVGTTMTSWLVALVGLKVKVEAFALPFIGLGMLLRLMGPSSRLGGVGHALAGFGALFLGLDLLKATFSDLGAAVDLQVIESWGLLGGLAGVGIGALITTLMQSSSAAMAVVLTASSQGLLSPFLAATLVIGANVGTTSTALLSTIGATPNARRVASLHVVFNLLTAAVALALVDVLLDAIAWGHGQLELAPSPAADLAVFHTVFNLLGLILMWPLAGVLIRFLGRRFRSVDEDDARPRHLDATVLPVPELGARALRLELERAGSKTLELVRDVVDRTITDTNLFTERARSRRRLLIEIADYATRMNRAVLTTEVAESLAGMLRAHENLWTMVRVAGDLVILRAESDETVPEVVPPLEPKYLACVRAALQAADTRRSDFDLEGCRLAREAHERARRSERKRIGAQTKSGKLPLPTSNQLLQELAHDRRLVNRAWKFAAALHAVRKDAPPDRTPKGEETASEAALAT